MKQDNSWRQCIICGKFISLKDIQDKRKVVWKQTESGGGIHQNTIISLLI
jgi:hypothetical protein